MLETRRKNDQFYNTCYIRSTLFRYGQPTPKRCHLRVSEKVGSRFLSLCLGRTQRNNPTMRYYQALHTISQYNQPRSSNVFRLEASVVLVDQYVSFSSKHQMLSSSEKPSLPSPLSS
jgi:hypothetical protein